MFCVYSSVECCETGVFVGGPVLGVACLECVFVCRMFGVFCVACCVHGRECYVVCEWFSVSCLVCDGTARVLRDVQRIVLSVACVLCAS